MEILNSIKFTFFVIMWACSTPVLVNPAPDYPNVDRRALKYVKEFEKHYGRSLNHVKVAFEDFKDFSFDGVCEYNTRQVMLSVKHWEMHDDTQREVLVFHELGHCVLNREHYEYNEREHPCSPSLMGYKGISSFCYNRKKQYYIDELFGRLK